MSSYRKLTSSILASPIMIVDDSAISRRKLTNDLTTKGFTNITEAVTGEDALNKLQNFTPALFLFDMLMPGMNGNELVRHVRKLKEHAHTPIIIVTVSEEEELIKECFSLGANDFLRKPWCADELSTRVTSQIERQQNMEYLSENKVRLSRAMEISTDGIWEFDFDTKEISLSPSSYKVLGMDDTRELSSDEIFELLHPEDKERIVSLFTASLKSSKNTFDFECRILIGNKITRWLSTRAKIAEFNPDGTPRLLIGVSKNITSQIIAQKHLQKFGKEMRDLAEERSDIIIHNERLAALGTMSAGIAHEISNPLSYIKGNIQLLMKTMPTIFQAISNEQICDESKTKLFSTLESTDSVLASLEDGIQRVCEIAKCMKNFSSKANSHKEIHDIAEAIDDSLLLCHNFLKNEIKVIRDYKFDEYLLPINIQQITQVLINLITNAAHAMHHCGTLTISTSKVDNYLIIKVADTGTGIPDQIKSKIFETFYTTKKSGEGTGLGLSISWDLIKDHNGRIAVEDGEKGGAVFKISLPLSDKPDAALNPIEPLDSPDELTILIAEDDLLMQEIVAQKLQVFSCNSVTATTVEDTLTQARRYNPDAIVLSMSATAPDSVVEIIKGLHAEKIFPPIFVLEAEHSRKFPLEELSKEINIGDFESFEIANSQDIGNIFC